jgi:hypothetical protein
MDVTIASDVELTVDTLLIAQSFNYLAYKREVMASSVKFLATISKVSKSATFSDMIDVDLLTKNLLIEHNSKKLFSKLNVVALLQRNPLQQFKDNVILFFKGVEKNVSFVFRAVILLIFPQIYPIPVIVLQENGKTGVCDSLLQKETILSEVHCLKLEFNVGFCHNV